MRRIALAIAAALILAGCSDGDGGSSADTSAEGTPPAATTPAPTSKAAPKAPDLRSTVEAMLAEGEELEATGSDPVPVFTKYATPECVELIKGIYESFGSGGEESTAPTEIVSVNDDGATGESVTRTGDGDPETQNWILQGGTWKFTCDDWFSMESDSESSGTTDGAGVEPIEVDGFPVVVGGPCPTEYGPDSNLAIDDIVCVDGTWE